MIWKPESGAKLPISRIWRCLLYIGAFKVDYTFWGLCFLDYSGGTRGLSSLKIGKEESDCFFRAVYLDTIYIFLIDRCLFGFLYIFGKRYCIL